MTKTIEEVKKELKLLNKKNPDIDEQMKREQTRKQRYDWLIECGDKKAADKVADSMHALKVKETMVTITSLENLYNEVFNRLSPFDCALAKLAFLDGLTYKRIAKKKEYSLERIKQLFNGRNENGKRYLGIFEKIEIIVNKREG